MPKQKKIEELSPKTNSETYDIIHRLRNFMFENNLTQKDLAALLDCGYDHFSSVMNCRRSFSPRMLWKILNLFKNYTPTQKTNENHKKTKAITKKSTSKL